MRAASSDDFVRLIPAALSLARPGARTDPGGRVCRGDAAERAPAQGRALRRNDGTRPRAARRVEWRSSDGRQAHTGAARAPRRRARGARGSEAPRDGRSDQRRPRPRRPVGELRVPRCEERAGPARAADRDAPRPVRPRRDRRGRRGGRRLRGSHVVVVNEFGARIDVEISALGGTGTVSPSSPLGSVVLGKQVGDYGRRSGAERRWRGRSSRSAQRQAPDRPGLEPLEIR